VATMSLTKFSRKFQLTYTTLWTFRTLAATPSKSRLTRSSWTLPSTPRSSLPKSKKMSRRHSAMAQSRPRARVASSRLRQFLKKLTARSSALRTRRSTWTMKAWSALSATEPKSTEEAYPAEGAMDQEFSQTSSILILSKLLRRKFVLTQLRPSKD
jgi:hypothetical protein